MKGLQDRVAIVTGGAAGIGLGIARVFAGEGASVVVADIDSAAGERAADSIRAAGGAATAVEVDVADRASVESMAAAALDAYGHIDVLAANAGVYRWDPLDRISDEIWDRIMDINVKGALYCIQACLPAMRGQQYGRIVLTSSITGAAVASEGLTHYAASKAAMVGMTRNAALELVGDGITVNAVLPGNVRTPGVTKMETGQSERVLRSIPLGRLAEPEDIGWAVRFFAAEEAGYITGQTLIVDGGQVLPEMRA